MQEEHQPQCPRLQFWDAGEYEAPCKCREDYIGVGTEVEWSSSANGTTKQKRGVVVAVVPANKWRVYLKDLMTDSLQNYAINGLDCMLYRKQESYIIAVPATGRGKAKLYWPRTSTLRKVQPDAWPVWQKENA